MNKVEANSRAETLGLRPGDVITDINGKEMTSIKDVQSAVKEGGSLTIRILRKREAMTLYEGADK